MIYIRIFEIKTNHFSLDKYVLYSKPYKINKIFTMKDEAEEQLELLDVVITYIAYEFKISAYCYPMYIGQYLNFNSLHQYSVENEINCCLQHWTKYIWSKSDIYQWMIIIIRNTLEGNDNLASIASSSKKRDRRIEDNNQESTTVYHTQSSTGLF